MINSMTLGKLTSVNLRVHICKMGVIIISTQGFIVRIK